MRTVAEAGREPSLAENVRDLMLAETPEEMRQRHIATLAKLTEVMTGHPEEVGPIVDAFERVLDIAACAPGGQMALIDGLYHCSNAQEVKAFFRSFAGVVAVNANCRGEGVPDAVHDMELTYAFG